MKRIAEFLTVGGEDILEGYEYFIVDAITGKITSCTAHTENCTIGNCYFRKESEAIIYSRLVKLAKPIRDAIKEIENKHLGK